MSVQVTLKEGVHDVVLPNGNRYNENDVVVLSDAEYGQMSPESVESVFSDVVAFDPNDAPGDPTPGT